MRGDVKSLPFVEEVPAAPGVGKEKPALSPHHHPQLWPSDSPMSFVSSTATTAGDLPISGRADPQSARSS